MTDIYWLQRIGYIHTLFEVMWIVVVCLLGFCILFAPIIYEMCKENEILPQAKKAVKLMLIMLCVGVFGSVSVPSKKELYAIYGLGGTIDYIKSNDKAKQLPDKCIDALTRYVDGIEKKNKKDNNN